jgi:hypothetical protein
MSFAQACRAADKKQKRKPADPHLELLRRLMRDDISLEQAWHVLNRAAQLDRAASSTVEALMYSLRQGVQALGQPNTLRRLCELSDDQLRDVAVRLQKFQPHIAPAWSPEDVEALVIVRSEALAENS